MRNTDLKSILAVTAASLLSCDAFVPIPSNSQQCDARPTHRVFVDNRFSKDVFTLMAKKTNRAHIERSFEKMMGDDWREFRAKLIAREKAEAELLAKEEAIRAKEVELQAKLAEVLAKETEILAKASEMNANSFEIEAIARQDSFYFADVVQVPTYSSDQDYDRDLWGLRETKYEHNDQDWWNTGRTPFHDYGTNQKIITVFDTIGNTNKPSFRSQTKTKVQSSRRNTLRINSASRVFGIDYAMKAKELETLYNTDWLENSFEFNDPFVTPDELPCHTQSSAERINLDKHRWAHEISHIEPGAVLIANEMLEGIFHQTVILVTEHNEKTGTIGVIINRPMDHDLFHIAYQSDETELDTAVKLAFGSSRVSFGGPSSTNEFKMIHGYGEVDGSRKLCPGVYIGGEDELMDELYDKRFDASSALFVKGHAEWGPGQLEQELQSKAWYMTAVSSDFILRYAGARITSADNPVDLWSDILSCMGGRHAEILKKHRGEGDCRLMP